FVEVLDLQFLDALRHAIAQARDDVVNQSLFGVSGHQPEKIPRLRVVVAIGPMIMPCHSSAHRVWPFDIRVVLRRPAETVRLIIHRSTAVSIEPHGTILVVSVITALSVVYPQGIVVLSQTIAVRIWV